MTRKTLLRSVAGALVVGGVAFGVVTLSLQSGSTGDTVASASYLRARAALEHTAEATITATRASAERVVSEIVHGCPAALARAPRQREGAVSRLGIEAIDAVWRAVLRSQQPAIETFADQVMRLRWSSASLTRFIHGVAAQEDAEARQTPPMTCRDIKAWVASGYRKLSAATRQVVSSGSGSGFGFVPAGSQSLPPTYDAVEPEQDSGKVALRRLRRYERPSDVILADRIRRSEVGLLQAYVTMLAEANTRLSRGLGQTAR